MNDLQSWHDFFMLTGEASATLLGLVFVSASIAATIPNEKLGDMKNRGLWFLPIVYAFVRVLVVGAVAVMPHMSLKEFGDFLMVLGIADLGRMVWVFRGLLRTHRTGERLVAGDWFWYMIAPALATILAGGTGAALALGNVWPLELVASAMVIHLSVGIHNAWELADWLATRQ